MSSSLGGRKLHDQIHKPTNNGLAGMEQHALPRSMLVNKKSSQSPNHYKPLPPPPPPPSVDRRISLSPPRQKSIFDEERPRRTSSVYSRTPSTWFSNSELPPRVPSLTEHPLPKINSIYRDSNITPSATMSEPRLLLPRIYSPLIATPSSTMSSEASPSPQPPLEQRPSALLPLPVPIPPVPKKHLHTVSLTKAQAAQHAPGSEHLLPEEQRARMATKARSSEHIVKLTDQVVDKPQKPGSAFRAQEESLALRLPSMMMLDAETWHTFDPSLRRSIEPQATYVNAAQIDPHWSGPTAIAMSRDQSLSQTGSATTSYSPLGEPERGRTTHRLPRGGLTSQPVQAPSDAERIAAEYTSLLAEPLDRRSPSQSHVRTSEEQAVKARLTPEPLFAFKSATGTPATIHDQQSSVSPKGLPHLATCYGDSWDTDDSLCDTPPPPHFFSPDSDRPGKCSRSYSRVGSIPISPPLQAPRLPPSPAITTQALVSRQPTANGRLMSARAKKQARESAYYPYVGRRRHGKLKTTAAGSKSRAEAQSSIAVNAARAAAQTAVSPAAQAPSSKTLGEVSELISRATNKAVRMADKLTRAADQEISQALSPANLGQSVTAVYLGWSEESKDGFDASKPISPKLHVATGKYGPRPVVKQTYSHAVTPARPLDERPDALAELSEAKQPGYMRRGSFLGGLLDLSREKGREKRREDIKRTIRMIPNNTNSAAESRPPIRHKSVSAGEADVSSPPQVIRPARGIWGRRISEFGLI